MKNMSGDKGIHRSFRPDHSQTWIHSPAGYAGIVSLLRSFLKIHSPAGYAGIGTLLRSYLKIHRPAGYAGIVSLLRSYSETKPVPIFNCVTAGVTIVQPNLLTTV